MSQLGVRHQYIQREGGEEGWIPIPIQRDMAFPDFLHVEAYGRHDPAVKSAVSVLIHFMWHRNQVNMSKCLTPM